VALDNEDRAFLEKTIDSIINQVPTIMTMARTEEYKKFFQYKDERGVVLALAMGMIYGGFVQYFITRHERNINPDETGETNGVILRRTREIKDAIFNCG